MFLFRVGRPWAPDQGGRGTTRLQPHSALRMHKVLAILPSRRLTPHGSHATHEARCHSLPLDAHSCAGLGASHAAPPVRVKKTAHSMREAGLPAFPRGVCMRMAHFRNMRVRGGRTCLTVPSSHTSSPHHHKRATQHAPSHMNMGSCCATLSQPAAAQAAAQAPSSRLTHSRPHDTHKTRTGQAHILTHAQCAARARARSRTRTPLPQRNISHERQSGCRWSGCTPTLAETRGDDMRFPPEGIM